MKSYRFKLIVDTCPQCGERFKDGHSTLDVNGHPFCQDDNNTVIEHLEAPLVLAESHPRVACRLCGLNLSYVTTAIPEGTDVRSPH
jgi:hypothetical protein